MSASLDVVVETRERFNEHVAALVGELVTTGCEEVQRLVEIKVEMSAHHRHRQHSLTYFSVRLARPAAESRTAGSVFC